MLHVQLISLSAYSIDIRGNMTDCVNRSTPYSNKNCRGYHVIGQTVRMGIVSVRKCCLHCRDPGAAHVDGGSGPVSLYDWVTSFGACTCLRSVYITSREGRAR
jgi:hypothetical protein